jgi:lipopolysaccharide/colanic/teichoic acid biosynthesis glycosyltransferase
MFLKRSIDIIFSGTGLLLLSPIYLVIAICIKLTSPGKVIYTQTRIGLNRQHFKIYKFRSMILGADQVGSSVTKYGDSRITAIGRFIRRTKLDELPQLWNVFIGDMSLVGPRPDIPEIIDLYTPRMLRILEIRPGMTSIASLHLRNESSLLKLANQPDQAYRKVIMPAKVKFAMVHVDHPSLLFDLQILLQTVLVLVIGKIYMIPDYPIVQELRQSIIGLNSQYLSTSFAD